MLHLLDIESLSASRLHGLLANADHFVEVISRDRKKVPALQGKSVVNLFLEASTRTRTSFEMAAKRLSADTTSITESASSISKGESLLDTCRTLEAMAPDILVIRHRESGTPNFLARELKTMHIVNAGDGMHEHPTQALLDCLTLMRQFSIKDPAKLSGLKIAIVGDVRHSRVARSSVWAHRLLGNSISLVGPSTLVPRELEEIPGWKGMVKVHHNIAEGIAGADVVMCLRLQLERAAQNYLPSLEEYSREFGLTPERLKMASREAVVLHPGPMNRGIEISSAVADSAVSLIQKQVFYGIAARMSVLFELAMEKNETAKNETIDVSESSIKLLEVNA